jgi:hypothetical protein
MKEIEYLGEHKIPDDSRDTEAIINMKKKHSIIERGTLKIDKDRFLDPLAIYSTDIDKWPEG